VGRSLKAMCAEPWTQADAIAWWQEHGRPDEIPNARAG
jgi:hypothetical protein